MYKRILVAVDGSATARLALEHALRLCMGQHARLRIVHVLEPIHYLPAFAGAHAFRASALFESMREEGRQVLASAVDAAWSAGVQAETALVEGRDAHDRAAKMLVQEAESWNADLIVLGTHGRRGLDRVMLGSVAETIVRLSHVPVLLVRARRENSQ